MPASTAILLMIKVAVKVHFHSARNHLNTRRLSVHAGATTPLVLEMDRVYSPEDGVPGRAVVRSTVCGPFLPVFCDKAEDDAIRAVR